MATDFYRTLGLDRSASAKEVSTAYRRLARQHHPDVSGGDPASESRFKEINAAHDVLGDEKKRAAYDKWGDQWEHAEQLEEMQRQRGGFSGFGGPGGTRIEFGDAAGFGGIGGLDDLGDLFGGIFGGHRGPARGRDVEHPVTISLAEAFHGVTRSIQAQRAAGEDGPRLSRLEVKIPAGAAAGTRVKVPGKGNPGPAGGPPGDLFLVVSVADDPRFERRGDDLRSDVEVPVHDAALGGEITVPTLTGQVALRIPQGTQNGRVFRLAGQGMPRLKRDGRGDLLVAVRLRMPAQLGPEHLDLFRRLRDLEAPDA